MVHAVRLCGRCGARPRKKHWNAKWCGLCARELCKRPAHKLTPKQIRMAKALLFKMPREEIARRVGTSVASLKRWARDEGGIRLAYFNRYAANPTLVEEVCTYYAKHGKTATAKAFPHVKVRSIVERYPHAPRQVRWTDEQLVQLARMGGLISMPAQAKFFDRPGANEGAIKKAWVSRFGSGGGHVNGLSYHLGRRFVRASCPLVETRFWQTRRSGQKPFGRKVYLWVDVAQHLRDDAPEALKLAAPVLAEFQRWLHGGAYARARIIRMMKEIEG